MSLGQRIRRLRTQAGLTQLQLAELVGVARSTVTQWELGASVPRAQRLGAIAAALGVGESELAYGEERPREPLVPLVLPPGPEADSLPASVEVPASLLVAHPDARAIYVADSSVDRAVPAGMVAVFDETLPPANGQLASERHLCYRYSYR